MREVQCLILFFNLGERVGEVKTDASLVRLRFVILISKTTPYDDISFAFISILSKLWIFSLWITRSRLKIYSFYGDFPCIRIDADDTEKHFLFVRMTPATYDVSIFGDGVFSPRKFFFSIVGGYRHCLRKNFWLKEKFQEKVFFFFFFTSVYKFQIG